MFWEHVQKTFKQRTYVKTVCENQLNNIKEDFNREKREDFDKKGSICRMLIVNFRLMVLGFKSRPEIQSFRMLKCF